MTTMALFHTRTDWWSCRCLLAFQSSNVRTLAESVFLLVHRLAWSELLDLFWMLAMSAVVFNQLFWNFLPQISSGGGLSFFRGSGGMREEKKNGRLLQRSKGQKLAILLKAWDPFPEAMDQRHRKKKKKTVIPQSLNQEEDSWGVLEELGDTPKMVPWSTTVETSCHARCRVTVSQGLTNKLSITRALINVKKITGDHVAGWLAQRAA